MLWGGAGGIPNPVHWEGPAGGRGWGAARGGQENTASPTPPCRPRLAGGGRAGGLRLAPPLEQPLLRRGDHPDPADVVVLRLGELLRGRVPLLVDEDLLGLEIELRPAQRVGLAGPEGLVAAEREPVRE